MKTVESIVKENFSVLGENEIVAGRNPVWERFAQSARSASEGTMVSRLSHDLTMLKFLQNVAEAVKNSDGRNMKSWATDDLPKIAPEFLVHVLNRLRNSMVVADKTLTLDLVEDIAKFNKDNTVDKPSKSPAPGIKMVPVPDFDDPLSLLTMKEDFYHDILVTDSIKNYCTASEEHLEKVWSFIQDALPRTIERIEQSLGACAQQNLSDPIVENIEIVSNSLQLDADERAVFLTLRHLFSKGGKINTILNPFPNVVFSAVDHVSGVPAGTTQQLFSTSKLFALGVLSSPDEKPNSFKVLEQLDEHFVEATATRYKNAKDLFFNISAKSLCLHHRQSELKAHDFKHMANDFENLAIALSSPTALKILVCGKQGSGKTAALHTAMPADRVFATPEIATAHVAKSVIFKKLRAYAPLCGSPVLLIDHGDEIIAKEKDASISLMKGQGDIPTTEVWVVNDIKKVPAEAMSAFDLVVNVPQMPLDQRLQLAKELFDDSYVAEQVSKTCVTPNEIQRLHHWSKISGQTQWKQLSLKASGLQQALVKAGTTTQELPLSVVAPSDNTDGFSTVVGCDDIVQQAQAAISCFRNPEKFKKLGGKVPKGLLLTGAPGTGKTHLARAMAHEAGVPLVCASSSALARNPELIGMVFEEAKRQAPCILFLDEVDAIGATAEQKNGASADPQRQAILNRLLVELSGFDDLTQVLVIGATHRPYVLDDALKRSGRLGWNISFGPPRRDSREQLWKHYGKEMEAPNMDWARVARISVGMSPADIAEAVNRSALNAAMDGADCVDIKHVLRAIDQVAWGIEGGRNCNDNQVYNTAVHEAGHALLVWAYNISTIDQISVKPSGGHLGFVRHFPDEEVIGTTQDDLSKRVEIAFGGLVAEEVVLGARSAGAVADLRQIRSTVARMFRDEGMGSAVMGVEWISASQDTKKIVEDEELVFARERKQNVTHLFKNNQALIKMVANQLVAHREISGEEFEAFVLSKGITREVFLNTTPPEVVNETSPDKVKVVQSM